MQTEESAANFTLNGPLLLRLWQEEAVLYHVPSATTLRVSPMLAVALEQLRQGPASVAGLCRLLAARFPGQEAPASHLAEGLERLRRAGILRSDDHPGRT